MCAAFYFITRTVGSFSKPSFQVLSIFDAKSPMDGVDGISVLRSVGKFPQLFDGECSIDDGMPFDDAGDVVAKCSHLQLLVFRGSHPVYFLPGEVAGCE
jgi:hypothetical protein